jgi:hypothetical protein
MVNKPRRPADSDTLCRVRRIGNPSYIRVAGRIVMVVLWTLGLAESLPAQDPEVHYLHHGVMPPGAIGSLQLARGGPLPGFLQPVEIKAPYGALISLAVAGQFDKPEPAPARLGLLIAPVYRIRVTGIPRHPGEEVFPTVEIIDRLYTPKGQERRFAIPIELTQEDLEMALEGKFVTRVIYLEDPQRALPVRSEPDAQNWFEAGPGRDPLAVADQLGRPVAIVRLGGRMPVNPQEPELDFLNGCPPLEKYASRIKILKPPPRREPPEAGPPAATPPQAAPPSPPSETKIVPPEAPMVPERPQP